MKTDSLKRLIKLYPDEVLCVLKNDSRIMAKQEKEIELLKKRVSELEDMLNCREKGIF